MTTETTKREVKPIAESVKALQVALRAQDEAIARRRKLEESMSARLATGDPSVPADVKGVTELQSQLALMPGAIARCQTAIQEREAELRGVLENLYRAVLVTAHEGKNSARKRIGDFLQAENCLPDARRGLADALYAANGKVREADQLLQAYSIVSAQRDPLRLVGELNAFLKRFPIDLN